MGELHAGSQTQANALKLGVYFAAAGKEALESRTTTLDANRALSSPMMGLFLQAAATSAAVDQMLQGHLGVENAAAALIEVILTVLGQRLRSDGDALRGVGKKLDAVLEHHLRVALDQFSESVALGLSGKYKDRFAHTAVRVQDALSSIDAQFKNGVMTKRDQRRLRFFYASIHAICATLCDDQHASSLRLTVASKALDELVSACEEEAVLLHEKTIPGLRAELKDTNDTEFRITNDDPDDVFGVAVGGYATKKQMILKRLRAARVEEEAALASATARLDHLNKVIGASNLMRALLYHAIVGAP